MLVETSAAWAAATITVDIGDSDDPQALAAAYDISSVVYDTGVNTNGTAWGDASGTGNPYSAQGTGKLYPAGDLITVIGTATTPAGPTGLTYVTLLMELGSIVRQSAVV